MNSGIQKTYKYLGDSGCYFFCINKIAEMAGTKLTNLTDTYYKLLDEKIITEDAFVNNAKLFIEALTGDEWIVSKTSYISSIMMADILSKNLKDAFIVARYVNGSYGHFVIINPENNEVIFDPLGESNTVKNGTIKSYRIFIRKR